MQNFTFEEDSVLIQIMGLENNKSPESPQGIGVGKTVLRMNVLAPVSSPAPIETAQAGTHIDTVTQAPELTGLQRLRSILINEIRSAREGEGEEVTESGKLQRLKSRIGKLFFQRDDRQAPDPRIAMKQEVVNSIERGESTPAIKYLDGETRKVINMIEKGVEVIEGKPTSKDFWIDMASANISLLSEIDPQQAGELQKELDKHT